MLPTRGRPAKLNEEIQKRILDAVRAGAYMETAAAFSGVHRDTLYEWMKRGRRELHRLSLSLDENVQPLPSEAAYVDFILQIEQALASAEVRDLLLIGEAAKKDWTAAAWRLERKFPSRYGRRNTTELVGAGGGAIRIENTEQMDTFTDDLLKRIARGEPVSLGDAAGVVSAGNTDTEEFST